MGWICSQELQPLAWSRLYLKALKSLPPDWQIADLEGRLSENMQVAPGMEQAYQGYRGLLQKALDEAKASHPNRPLKANEALR